MAGIKYLEKKNNNWYERFWIEERFTSPGDIYVQLLPSTAHAEGIVVVFDLSEEVIKKDSRSNNFKWLSCKFSLFTKPLKYSTI